MFPLSTQHSESLRLTLQQFVADKTAEILLIRIKHQSINQSLIKTSYNILLKSGRDIWVLQNTPPPEKRNKKKVIGITNCANLSPGLVFRSLDLYNSCSSIAICSLDLHNSFLGWIAILSLEFLDLHNSFSRIAIRSLDLHNSFLWIYWFRRCTQLVLLAFTV